MNRISRRIAGALIGAAIGFSSTAYAGPALGPPNTLASAVNADGRIELFRVNATGVVEHVWQSKVDGPFSAPAPFDDQTRDPAPFTTLAVGKNKSGRLEVFAAKSDGTVWHRWQRNPNGTEGWVGWENIDGTVMRKLFSRVAVGNNIDGTLSVYGIAVDDAKVYRKTQLVADGGWAESWISFIAEPTRQLAATTTKHGGTSLVAVSTSSILSHRIVTVGTNVASCPQVASPVAAQLVSNATGGDGRIVLFATRADGSVGRVAIGSGGSCAAGYQAWADVLPASSGRGSVTAYQMPGGRLAVMAQRGTTGERYDTATETYPGTLVFNPGAFGWGMQLRR